MLIIVDGGFEGLRENADGREWMDSQTKKLFEDTNELIRYRNEHDRTMPPRDRNEHDRTRDYRGLEELDVARRFVQWYREERGVELTDLRINPNDPPDCLALRNGQQVGIEITELVDQEGRSRVIAYTRAKKRETGESISELPSRERDTIRGADWCRSMRHEPDEFVQKLHRTIAHKDSKLANCEDVVLVIFFRDKWLEQALVTGWLADQKFEADNIKGAFLRGCFEDGYPIWELLA